MKWQSHFIEGLQLFTGRDLKVTPGRSKL